MSNTPVKLGSWEKLKNEIFTPEEIEESRIAVMLEVQMLAAADEAERNGIISSKDRQAVNSFIDWIAATGKLDFLQGQ